MPQQAAEGEEEVMTFAPSTIAVIRLTAFVLTTPRTLPAVQNQIQLPVQGRQRHLREGVMQNRTAGRNIGEVRI